MSLRILQLCNKPPLPAVDGGALAMIRMTEGLLAAGHEVRVLAIATDKHPWQPEKIPADLLEKTKMDAQYIDTNVRWLPAFLSLFKTSSYNIDRFYDFGFEAKLIEILAHNEFDIVQLESLFVCPYISAIRRISKAKIVLRAHNTESSIWKKNAEEEHDPFKKLWLKDLAGKLERYERKAVSEVDAIVPITREDEERLRALGATAPMQTISFAMNAPFLQLQSQPFVPGNTVYHLGAMDWKPNYDGVKWLADTVWPIVLKSVPQAELHLAGKAMNKEEFSGRNNVIAYGEVPDAAAFTGKHNILAIPIHAGAGMRIKMVEAMFAGKAVVTTPLGAEGIEGRIGTDYFVAVTAEEFAARLIELLNNPELAAKMGQHARQTAHENHDLKRLSEKISDFYKTIL